VEEAQAKNHQSVDWSAYFKSIRAECPWSLPAYEQGLIDIVDYTGQALPLGNYSARVYMITAPDETVEAICAGLNYGHDEWLFSYPGYGPFAAPVSILIQQNKQELNQIRARLK
jgi:hypothetical protein